MNKEEALKLLKLIKGKTKKLIYKQIEEIVIYEDLFGYSWYDAAQKTVLFEGDIQSEIGLIHWTIYKAKIIAFNEETSYLILTIKNPGEEIEIYELK